MNEIRQKAHEIREEVIAFRRDLHMYPELSMEEFRTSDQVAAMLDKLRRGEAVSTATLGEALSGEEMSLLVSLLQKPELLKKGGN